MMEWNKGCGAVGPFTKTTKTKTGRPDRVIALRCNRPSGHDGNHLWSDGYRGSRYEWTRDGVRVTYRQKARG